MTLQRMERHQQVPVKVTAFRQFASNLVTQLMEQLCVEFEREVSTLTEDLVLYQAELARCGELLAHQLGRERQLHGMLENIAGNTGNLAASAGELGKSGSNEAFRRQMHELVEQLFGHSTHLLSNTVNGVNEAHSVAYNHLTLAKELQNHAQNTEQELNRIMSLLGASPVVSTPRSEISQAKAIPVPTHPVQTLTTGSPFPPGMPRQLPSPPVLGTMNMAMMPGTARNGGAVCGSPGSEVESNCIKCGNAYAADSIFCRRCGHKRMEASPSHGKIEVVTCARCGNAYADADSQFCRRCGHKRH
ncbi:unnamed protein product [Cladocopium goreaui]|uniref:DZANK-type domain-containing protein n=1 Tax=Cladocopium goreaui TaxID=2562237 RepID=A0A9P1G3Y4_9DINO|nr:unnamed protein product [Cladocopium goreaui]